MWLLWQWMNISDNPHEVCQGWFELLFTRRYQRTWCGCEVKSSALKGHVQNRSNKKSIFSNARHLIIRQGIQQKTLLTFLRTMTTRVTKRIMCQNPDNWRRAEVYLIKFQLVEHTTEALGLTCFLLLLMVLNVATWAHPQTLRHNHPHKLGNVLWACSIRLRLCGECTVTQEYVHTYTTYM